MARKVSAYAYTMEKPEQLAVLRLWRRDGRELYTRRDLYGSYRGFRRGFRYSNMVGCWLGGYAGVVVGIESDGYTHS